MITQQCGRYLFKVFRAIWLNEESDLVGDNVTSNYIRKYIGNVDAKCSVKYAGDFHDAQVGSPRFIGAES